MKKSILLLILSGFLTATGISQSLSYKYRTNGHETVKIFEPERQVLQQSSAVLYRGYKRITYGTIVSKDGYLLTKASELQLEKKEKKEASKNDNKKPKEAQKKDKKRKPLSLRIGKNQLYKEIEIVAIDDTWDIALLKIPAKNLTPVNFATTTELKQGTWVVSNGASSRHRRRVRVGVISANTRMITGGLPFALGIQFEEKKEQLLIKKVIPEFGAAKAGVKKDDILVAFEGKPLKKRDDLVKLLVHKKAQDQVNLTLQRGEETLQLQVTLLPKPKTSNPRPMGRNDQMSGRFSPRRDRFPKVLQIDTPASRHSCGGPLLNLKGECVGMVIARASREATYAIPAAELQTIFKKLKTQKK